MVLLPAEASDLSFLDIARDPSRGLSYERVPSTRDAVWEQLRLITPFRPEVELRFSPTRTRGLPGIALLDYDRDGDLDIYVTNGPGAANSLFRNRLVPYGQLAFDDVAASAGVDATLQDSDGTCFGDLDNDGDSDLLVLGAMEPHRLFANQGDGTFADITAAAGLDGNTKGAMSCSMADIDGDGLLDIAISSVFDMSELYAIHAELYSYNDANDLFRNLGGLEFEDVSESSGIREIAGFPAGAAGISWAITFFDYDQDGDPDLLIAEDQGGILPGQYGGTDRGYPRLFDNDGSGHFTDRTYEAGLDAWGSWMGLSVGDLNCDGNLDFFGSNFGDYALTAIPFVPHELGDQTSRWWLSDGQGGFTDPGVGDLIATPFGWGTTVFDADNDGDPDILYHGGLDLNLVVVADNPGVMLENQDCSANFEWAEQAFAGSVDHLTRTVQGVASGDLNNDGRLDVVSASNFNVDPTTTPLLPYPRAFGSPFDSLARFAPAFFPIGPELFQWAGFSLQNGTLAVELNQTQNRNGSVFIEPVGGAGRTIGARHNRDGIGAVVRFKPHRGRQATRAILGGSSYLSQDAIAAHFGTGSASFGTAEVLWTGGTVNRLYGLRRGERIRFPEIPCSAADPSQGFVAYQACVATSLNQLRTDGELSRREATRFFASAIVAYFDRR